MGTFVSATADPVKNDASEAFDVLAKMDPARYSDRDAFLRKYGVDTASSRDGLRREMARHFFTGNIDPGVKAERKQIKVDLGSGQKDQIKALDDAAAAMRLARMKGSADVAAARRLSPGSFEGAPEAQHEVIAKDLSRSIGIVHAAAVQHALSGEAKTDRLAQLAHERKGKPGVVFAHSLDRVQQIADRLTKDGHKVITLSGGDSTAEKDRKLRAYKDGKHDIIVCSDAGAVGANLQRGKYLVQYDTPMTAMLHAQRNGRINRVGQTGDVELLDLVADHPAERKARDRLTKKYALRDIMTSPLEGLDDSGMAGHLARVRAGREEFPGAPALHASGGAPTSAGSAP
jgi:superfamily II DNA or RNA helicase